MLTDDDFTQDSVTYHITGIAFQRSQSINPWSFAVTFDKAIPQALKNSLELDFSSKQFSFSSASSYTNSDKTVNWDESIESTFQVATGNTLSMSLNRDTTAPTVNSAAVNGTALTITFNESLAAAANLANGAFEVKKTPQGGDEETVMLSGSPSISGATVTLTLGSTVLSTDTDVKVGYTKPTTGSNNKLKDSSDNEVADFSNQQVTNNTPDLPVQPPSPPPPPPPPPPVIESPEGVSHSGNPNDGFSLTPIEEQGSIVYRKRTIDITVTRDEGLSSAGDPALIIPRSVLDRVREITFELSEVSPQDPPSGFRLGGYVVNIDLGVTLGQRETVAVCLPPADVKGESYVHRYDGEWEILPSRLETVNGEELVCGDTDTFSLFGAFLPVIESAEGVTHSEDAEYGFSLTPLGEGGSIVYGEKTIDLLVTGDVGSSRDPAVIVSRSVLDRIDEITFELSEVPPHDPPPGFYLEGFAAEVDLGVTLGEGETVSVCLPSSGGDIYRYSEESGEWEVLESSRPEMVNGEEVVCGDVGEVSLTGVFVEDTGGCVIASAGGERSPVAGSRV